MKKLAISLLAVLALLVCVITVTAPKAQAADDVILYHCVCGNKHSTALTDGEITWKEGTNACYEGCDGEILEWTAWNANSPKVAGNYYMISNHTTVRQLTYGANINIDMNGYKVEVTGNYRAINMGSGTVNICNTKTTGGTISGYGYDNNTGAAIKVYGSSTLTLYGVDVSVYNSGNATTTDGGAVYVNGSTFNMYGGSLTGCTVTASGGTLYLDASSKAHLYDVTISGGTAGAHGGNIYTKSDSSGTILLDGCTIYGGVAGENGGNIWLGYAAEGAELAKMVGCTVYGGEASSGGSVMIGRRLAMNGGSIGIDPDGNEAGGVAANRGGNVFINDAELVMNLTATIASGNSGSTNGGNVFVTGTNGNGKLTMNNTSSVKSGFNTADGGNVYINAGALYMGGSSSIIGGDTSGNGANVYMAAGTARMLSSSLIAGGGFTGVYGNNNATPTTRDGGNVYIAQGAEFTMSGTSNVRNGMDIAAGFQSGNFFVAGTLNITDSATVYGGKTGAVNRNIHIYGGTLNLSGAAKIDGGITAASGTVILSGTVTVDTYQDSRADRTIYLAADVVMDASGLTEGACVKLYDSPASEHQIATVAAEQTAIKEMVSLSEINKLDGFLITRERDSEGNVSLWLRTAVPAQLRVGEKDVYDYQSLAVAMEAYEASNQLILDADATDITVARNMLIDLNGFDLTNLTIAEGVTLTGMDSATDTYADDADFGLITLSESSKGSIATDVKTTAQNAGAVKRYLTVTEGGNTSFHRFYVGITSISLNPSSVALGYKAAFYGDSTVRSMVTGFGYNIWVNDGDAKTYTKDGSFTNGQVLTLRVNNILSDNENASTSGAAATIGGNAFIVFNNGITVSSTAYETTLRDMVETVNSNWSIYSDVQKAAAQTMCQTFEKYMEGWAVTNILAWTSGTEETA